MSRINSFEEYQQVYKDSINDPEKFWEEQAEQFVWKKKWDKVLDWNFTEPKIEWFKGGKLNITENCLDRHLEKRGDQVAYYWEPNEPGEKAIELTYTQLHEQVCKFANVLKSNGAKKGDRICIYMPMVPELAIAVLACARIGAIHSVVFGGFSASAVAGRIQDCQCNVVITSDGAYRGGKVIPMKDVIDEALETCPSVQKVIVTVRTQTAVKILEGRDVLWADEMKNASDECIAEPMDAEDMLFILYTSGSTGKPKGVVHTCGGYMVYTHYTFENVFQYRSPEPSPVLPEGKRGVPGYYTTNATLFKLISKHAKRMRDNPTPAENMLWNSLKSHKAGYHIRRQHIIGKFIVDFVCLERKVVIEVDGDIHDHQIEEDAQRTAFLNEEGFEVIRFRNEDVYEDVHFISLKIESILDSRKSYDIGDNSLPPGEGRGGVLSNSKPKLNENKNKIIGDNSLPSREGRGGVFWCTADIGWITGHSYIVYAPLLA
nr:AMP-binding protein [Bacteroidota bacterium]